MLPNWSRPESFWQSKWQDDRLGRQSKGSERSFWTAPCYLLFLCRIIILRLFTPWTLIGIANADVQWLSIRIKDANNVKWGHVSKAAPFPWLFITPSSAENFIITEAVLYLVETRAAFTLFFSRSSHCFAQVPRTCCCNGNASLHNKGKSWTEKIRCSDIVKKVQKDGATTEGKAKREPGTGAPVRQDGFMKLCHCSRKEKRKTDGSADGWRAK